MLPYQHKSIIEDIYIVPEEYSTLLGRVWIRKLDVDLTQTDTVNVISKSINSIEKVQQILFRYRATPLIDGKSPSEKYLHRQIRIHLDALKPTKFQKNLPTSNKTRQLKVGDRVQARYYARNKQHWELGTVIQKFGNLHYLIKLDNGFVFKRHIDQLNRTSIPKHDKETLPNQEQDAEPETEINPTSIRQYVTFIPRKKSTVVPEPTLPLRSALASRPRRIIKRPVRFLI